MRVRWSVALLLLGASLFAAGASALPAERHVTLEADDGDGCTSGQKVDCFRVANGSLEGLTQGMRVHLQLENVGSNPHNAYVAPGADADENNVDTPASAAVNNTETVDAGSSASMVFEIPEDAGSLYIWCDVQGHEALGMWLNASVEASSTGEPGDADEANTTNGPGDGGASTQTGEGSAVPAPGVLALAGVLAGVAALTRRGR